jgi:hypothetical protein
MVRYHVERIRVRQKRDTAIDKLVLNASILLSIE